MKSRFVPVLLLSAMALPVRAADPPRPNILFILADDLGGKDLASYGSTFHRSPNLDRLADSGVRFTQAYATPLCSPSRAMALTGRNPARIAMAAAIAAGTVPAPIVPESTFPYQKVVDPQSRDHLPLDEPSIAEILKARGYETWFAGKWHLGAEGRFGPKLQGFDKVVCAGGAAAGYFSPYKWLPGLKAGPDGEYLTERLTNEAIAFLRGRPADAPPFFMALWHFNVHDPLEAKADVIEKYKPLVDPKNPQRNPVMAAMIEALDDGVGALLATLDELGLSENTMVVFAADNGGVTYASGPEAAMPGGARPTSNAPLRGGKGSIFEGGVRVPLIIRWPGVSKPGLVNADPVQLCDLLPTFADAAGAALPKGVDFDGVTLRPALEGRPLDRKVPIFWHFPFPNKVNGARQASAIREGDFKLIRFYGEGPGLAPKDELYNVVTDVSESRDVAKENPELAASLGVKLDARLKETGALMPIANPAYNPKEPLPKRWKAMENP